jgi:undecaprenyl-diphosphatase
MDSGILLWIQEVVRNPILNPIVTFITHLGDAGMIWMAVTAVLLVIPKTRKIGVCCFFGLLVMFIVNNLVIKNAVARIRPYEVIEGLERLVEKPVDYSFPSGHTSAGITAAYVITRMAKKKRYAIPAIILAVLIGLSRLYVGVHYPTDVMGGALLGLLYGELGYRIGTYLAKKREERVALTE